MSVGCFEGTGVAATFSKQMAGFRSVLLGYVIKLLTFRFSHKLTGAKGYRNGASAEAVSAVSTNDEELVHYTYLLSIICIGFTAI